MATTSRSKDSEKPSKEPMNPIIIALIGLVGTVVTVFAKDCHCQPNPSKTVIVEPLPRVEPAPVVIPKPPIEIPEFCGRVVTTNEMPIGSATIRCGSNDTLTNSEGHFCIKLIGEQKKFCIFASKGGSTESKVFTIDKSNTDEAVIRIDYRDIDNN